MITELTTCPHCGHHWQAEVNQGVECPKCGVGAYLDRPAREMEQVAEKASIEVVEKIKGVPFEDWLKVIQEKFIKIIDPLDAKRRDYIGIIESLRLIFPESKGDDFVPIIASVVKERNRLKHSGAESPAILVQPKPHGTGPRIVDLVKADLDAKATVGVAKYGEPLKAFNGRDPLVDLYQELLDAVQYLRQHLEERAAYAPEKPVPNSQISSI